MRIAYDHQIFSLQKTGGIGRYFCRLVDQLHAMHQDTGVKESAEVGVFAPFYRNQYLSQLPSGIVHGKQVKDYLPKTAGLMVGVNGLISRHKLRQWHPDLVHETYFSKIRSAPQKTPVVLTVFDMIGELGVGVGGRSLSTQGLASMRQSDKYAAVARADHVICISEHTRKDLITFFDTPENKVSVAYLGCDGLPLGQTPQAVLLEDVESLNEQRPFLLYVGLRGGYKNFTALLQAIALSAKLKDSFDLIAFGGGTLTMMEREQIKALGFKPNQIKQFGGDDHALAALYQKASALVYPSIYEGFGLPPIEAMSLKCPVVCSHTSSIPEVVGEAGEYFDPRQPESMALAIENVVFSRERTEVLITKGLERAKYFTWDRCAEKHLSVYQSLIHT
jgi:glycosyltransferase involved in cell wall biosynthesis